MQRTCRILQGTFSYFCCVSEAERYIWIRPNKKCVSCHMLKKYTIHFLINQSIDSDVYLKNNFNFANVLVTLVSVLGLSEMYY